LVCENFFNNKIALSVSFIKSTISLIIWI